MNILKILIVPGNVENAKSYPFWDMLVSSLHFLGHEVKKISGTLQTQEIIDLVNWSDKWISIDSFLPHLVRFHKLKSGIVLWGKSDPKIFGYEENVNLLKDRKYLRFEQFKWWKDEPHNPEAFVTPEEIYRHL